MNGVEVMVKSLGDPLALLHFYSGNGSVVWSRGTMVTWNNGHVEL